MWNHGGADGMPGKGYADLFLRRLSSLMEMTAFEAGTGGVLFVFLGHAAQMAFSSPIVGFVGIVWWLIVI
jgi:hypothetical protein